MLKQKVQLRWDGENYVFPKVTKMGSIIWPQNRLQWGSGSERIAAYTQRSSAMRYGLSSCMSDKTT